MPDEIPLSETPVLSLNERRIAVLAIWLLPTISLLGLPIWHSFFAYCINLRKPEIWWEWNVYHDYRLVLLIIVVAVIPSALWLGWLWGRKRYGFIPSYADYCCTLIVLALLAFGWQRPGYQWYFLEASKIRTEKYSFLRALVFWRSADLFGIEKFAGKSKIVAVGSSQVNFALDPVLFHKLNDRFVLIKRTLPGFSILQYLTVGDDVIDNADAVICWLSEFDLFREERLPANRLRAFGGITDSVRFCYALGWRKSWENRSELMDIALASYPLWRDRDIAKNLFERFWWRANNFSQSSVDEKKQNGISVIAGKQWERQRRNMKRNIRRTSMLSANIASFAMFAQKLKQNGICLIVFEGTSNPLAISVLDPALREEARQVFSAMAEKIGFTYVPASQMPVWKSTDFCDAYHLNQKARERFTRYLNVYLKKHFR